MIFYFGMQILVGLLGRRGSSMIGGTALVYDDALDYPESDTWCKLISKHKVTIFGAAPTAIRLFMKIILI
jgi:acyl-coenzyme A synthetase/AMP-(fatty) acid ligase